MKKNVNITLENFNQIMKNKVELYNEQPMYLLRINQEYCTYEVLVNDFPVKEYYRSGKLATAIKINRAILKSGPQKVTIRMYPYGDLLQQEFGEDQPYMSTLKKGSAMLVEVIKVPDWKNYNISKEESIKVVKTEGYDNQEFVGAGLPFYEFSFTFNAEVPFEFEGWTNGIDLRKVDSTLLKQKIISYFKGYQKIYEEENINKYFKINFDKTARNLTSNYYAHKAHSGDQVFEEIKEQFLNSLLKKNKDFLPLKDYELSFFGEGKVVTLKQSSSFKVDKRFRGKSALHFLYQNEDEEFRRMISPYIYLYLPKDKYTGKDEDIQLEMIK
ncbi:hypothetical protein Q4599_17215 [Cellulophaga lytica]|uniref:hypothetical protein n=2 Tax=Cellulophaga lytica TaxID=979 RepID=UPI000ADD006E|nr:hypothetical protein [Cellulophaga lytica]MDO6855325.1 hypothetical protein [Cellulophaga lytica]